MLRMKPGSWPIQRIGGSPLALEAEMSMKSIWQWMQAISTKTTLYKQYMCRSPWL